MNKGRLEAFKDAVIAIAATIMVLELRPPKGVTLKTLSQDWPILLSYIVSFTLIYVVWYSHHNIFNKAKIISTRTFLLNGLWLFVLNLVPFATAWVGQHIDKTVPEVVYLIVMFLWSAIFQLMDQSILKDNPEMRPDNSNRLSSRLLLYGTNIFGIFLAFVWPIGALLTVGVISMIHMIDLLRVSPVHPTE